MLPRLLSSGGVQACPKANRLWRGTDVRPRSLSQGNRQAAVSGRFAAEIRALRPPEPYKGKGVRYADEYVRSARKPRRRNRVAAIMHAKKTQRMRLRPSETNSDAASASSGPIACAVHRTPRHIYAQIISATGQSGTWSAASTARGRSARRRYDRATFRRPKRVGQLELPSGRKRKAGIEAVAFDRSGFKFHGRVKALADAARVPPA